MYGILFTIFAILNLGLIIHYINKYIYGNRILKCIAIILLYLSINTLSGMLGFYIGGERINRWYLLVAHLIFIGIEIFILRISKNIGTVEIKLSGNKQEIVWLFSFLILFIVLLFSTDFSFMPVWGNVDESSHIEISVQLRNILDGMSNPFYRRLGSMEPYITRYSYLWGYHYNCAVLSKIFYIDVLYTDHAIKCLSLSAFVTTPMLWMRTKNKVAAYVSICYIALIVLFAGNWYVFFSSGYTPQLFSLAICNGAIALISNNKGDKRVIDDIIIPVLSLSCMAAYMLTGAILFCYVLGRYVVKKKVKNIIILCLTFLYMIPLPPIWNQLKFFLFGEGVVDEALVAASVLKVPPSALWIWIGVGLSISIIVYIKQEKLENIAWLMFIIVEYILFIGIYTLYDNMGYIMYKVMISLFPPMVFAICFLIIDGTEGRAKAKAAGDWAVLAGMAGVVLLLVNAGVARISWDNIKNIGKAKPQISINEYRCMQAVADYDDIDGIEYIGMNGPSAQTGFVLLRAIPFSWTEEGKGWIFRSNFSIENLFTSAIERRMAGEKYKCIYVIINEDNAFDIESIEKYNALLSESKEIFRMGNCCVRRLVFIPFKVQRLPYNELIQKSEYTEGNVPTYGTVALVNQNDKVITYDYRYKKPVKLSLIDIKGRSIHDSECLIRLFYEGKMVWEKDISGFQEEILLDLGEGVVCDEYKLEVIGRRFSNSIIIQNIDLMGVEMK